MLTDKEKEIALEYGIKPTKADAFLSRVREEQEAVAVVVYDGYPCHEASIYVNNLFLAAETKLFTTPPAVPKKDCDNCMALAMLRKSELGNLKTIRHLKEDCAELVEALAKISRIEDNLHGGDWDEIEEARGIANKALANHTKRQQKPPALKVGDTCDGPWPTMKRKIDGPL